jgi:hypothetical protein
VPSDVAIDQAGDALAVWSSGNQNVRGAYRSAGQSFGSAFDIGTGINPQASMDAVGGATVIWAGGDGILHGRTGRGTSFGQQFDLSTQQVGEYALAANAAGDTVAASTESNGSILHAVLTPAGGGQPIPQDLEDNGIFAGSSQDGGPAAAVDPAGSATVLWYHSNPGGYRSIRAAFRPAGGSFGSPLDLSLPAWTRPVPTLRQIRVATRSTCGSAMTRQRGSRPCRRCCRRRHRPARRHPVPAGSVPSAASRDLRRGRAVQAHRRRFLRGSTCFASRRARSRRWGGSSTAAAWRSRPGTAGCAGARGPCRFASASTRRAPEPSR